MARSVFGDPKCLDRFAVMLGAVGAAAVIGTGGATAGLGAVAVASSVLQIGCSARATILDRLRGKRSNAPAVLEAHLERVRKNWRAWSGYSSVRDRGGQENAIRCFEEYFSEDAAETRLPAAEAIMAAGRNANALASAMLDRAAEVDTSRYGNKPVNELARTFFRDVTRKALQALLKDRDFAGLLQPAFQEAAIGYLQRIDATTQRTEQAVGNVAAGQADESRLAAARHEEQRRWHREQMAAINREKGVPLATLETFFAALGEHGVADAEIETRLEKFAEDYLALKAQWERVSNETPEVAEIRREALSLIDKGRFDDARHRLSTARATIRESRQQRAREEAELLAAEAEIDRLELRYRNAAALHGEVAELVAFDPRASWAGRLAQAKALYDQGNEFGENAALEDAINVFRQQAMPLVDRERVPLDWAMTQNNLGNALSTLGGRESGTGRLKEAVDAYRAALQEYTRERVPLQWATTQNNLGAALRTLGERESDTGRLKEAVDAYRAALQERTRQRVPLSWAMTQNNLGNALSTLGERESGTGRLKEAVDAFRAALQEQTRERVPLQWAMAQNNLGAVLRTLGEREGGTARLQEAVDAYRAALQERTRERVPLQWAMTQNNLGNALRILGERESDTGRLKEAVDAYRAALQEFTRERVPLDWATTQNNLGSALATLGERESDTGRLKEAVKAYGAALQERTRQRVPLQWAMTMENLAIVRLVLFGKSGDAADLAAAREAVTGALEVYRDARSEYDIGTAERLLASIDAAGGSS